ncbi:unnamed protein product [Closterium sp. NIES-65]|nr:unnamed protein product [Closterium sp. NIES-65]
MASPTLLTFDAKGCAVDFNVWVDDLQLYLQCDSRDGVSLFDHTSGASVAPATDAASTVRSQWTTRDADARLAVRSHLPSAERAHFGQYKTTKSLRSGLRLVLVGGAAAARGKGGKGGGGDGGGAVVAVEEAQGVGVEVGVVAGVGASLAGGGGGAGSGGGTGGVAAAVVLVGVEPCSVEALVVASVSSSHVPVRPRRPSSFVSGTLGVGGLGVLVPVLTFSAPASIVGRRAGCPMQRNAISVASVLVFVPCVFLGFPPDALGWQFYHPTSRRFLSSHDITFDESVPYYRLFPYALPLSPPPLTALPSTRSSFGRPPPPQGPAPSGVSQVDPVEPVEVAVDSGAAGGAEPAGTGPRGAEPERAELEVLSLGLLILRVRSLGVLSLGLLSLRVWSLGVVSLSVKSLGVLSVSVLSLEVLRPLEVLRVSCPDGCHSPNRSCASGLLGAGAMLLGLGGLPLEVLLELGVLLLLELLEVLEPLVPKVLVLEVLELLGLVVLLELELEALELLLLGVRLELELLEVLELVVLPELELEALGLFLLEVPLELELLLVLELVALQKLELETLEMGALVLSLLPESRPSSSVRAACTGRRVSRPRPPPLPGMHQMAFRPSSVPLRVPLPSPPASSLASGPDPESDSLRAASPTITCLLATIVTDPSFKSTATSALVAELVDFAARCRLDYAASLVAESESVCPPSVGGECALSTDVLEDRQEDFECFAAAVPHLVSMLIAPEGDPMH